jgi:hypothetical protein
MTCEEILNQAMATAPMPQMPDLTAESGRMVYNELEQGGILSGVGIRLATMPYADILWRAMSVIHRIRQASGSYFSEKERVYHECTHLLGRGFGHIGSSRAGR